MPSQICVAMIRRVQRAYRTLFSPPTATGFTIRCWEGRSTENFTQRALFLQRHCQSVRRHGQQALVGGDDGSADPSGRDKVHAVEDRMTEIKCEIERITKEVFVRVPNLDERWKPVASHFHNRPVNEFLAPILPRRIDRFDRQKARRVQFRTRY